MEQQIGKYKIVREIGKGGMGIVYKGIDPSDEKQVAIKVLPTSMVDRAMVARFHREVQSMSKFRHPNLLEEYDYGMTQGQHFYAMEYLLKRQEYDTPQIHEHTYIYLRIYTPHRANLSKRHKHPFAICFQKDSQIRIGNFA